MKQQRLDVTTPRNNEASKQGCLDATTKQQNDKETTPQNNKETTPQNKEAITK